MKKNLSIVIIMFFHFLLPGVVKAQTWQWAKGAGGMENDCANSIDIDQSGNTYVTGSFYNSIAFDSITLMSPGTTSVFIAKFDMNGNIIWAKVAASDSAISVSGIHADVAGNISITGHYFGTATFGTSVQINLNSTADYDVFIARYNNMGDITWVKSFGGPGNDDAGGVCTDNDCNVFITGEFHLSSFPFSGAKIFVTKYDSAGNSLWLQLSQNYGTGHFGNGIKTDSAGNSYITGSFFNALAFDSSLVINAGNIESNVFTAKFNSSGAMLWGAKAGAASGYAGGRAIDIDESGNSYICGIYHGTISFGPISIMGTSGSAYDVFVAKINATGTYDWVNASIGSGSAKGISFNNSGHCFITGDFTQSITFGQTVLTNISGNDIFIAGLDQQGNFIWATQCGGLYNSGACGIKANSNEVSIAGNFLDTMNFGSSFMLVANSNVKTDIFLAKLNIPSGIPENGFAGIMNPPYPNPTLDKMNISFFLHSKSDVEIIIYDSMDKEISRISKRQMNAGKNSISYEVSNLARGIYIVKLIIQDGNPLTYKLIKS